MKSMEEERHSWLCRRTRGHGNPQAQKFTLVVYNHDQTPLERAVYASDPKEAESLGQELFAIGLVDLDAEYIQRVEVRSGNNSVILDR